CRRQRSRPAVRRSRASAGRRARHRHRSRSVRGRQRSPRGSPEKLNEDPHGAAWLVKIRLSNPAQISGLLSAADYQSYIGE
ncbi:MAG: hypothetical protein HYZ37_05140, partial [Candidatus Solibacter usitatus]|nr:hypothetical protein [Candidatus Solibacter usitatus]